MRNEYLELQIHMPDADTFVHSDRFRGRIRELADKYADAGRPYQLPPELFHKDDQAEDRTAAPGIRFGGGPGKGRINAIGEEAVDLLDRVGHKVTRILATEYGHPLQEEWHAGQLGVRFRPDLQWYRVPRMVIQKSGKHHDLERADRAGELTNELVTPYVAHHVRKGIADQADLVGVDYDEDFLLGNVTFESSFPLPIHRGGRSHMLVLKNVQFAMSLDLKGPWHVGYMRARGFGYLTRPRGADGLKAAS